MDGSIAARWRRKTIAAAVMVAAVATVGTAVPATAAQPPGKPASFCGNGIVEKNEQCDQSNLNGGTCQSVGFAGGSLSCGANCQFDTSRCTSYQTAFQTCQTNLGSCQAATCGNGVAEFGEQCDGESLQGQTCQTEGFTYGKLACSGSCTLDTSKCTSSRFVDNGDGTVTDNETELVWEKKNDGKSSSNDSQGVGECLHCVKDIYTWAPAMSEWTSALNGRTNDSTTQSGFAGHTDWRLPSIVELQTIVDTNATGCGSGSPCIDPVFGPTASDFYWSASTLASFPDGAWPVNFNFGYVFNAFKTDGNFVRAVRGGSN